MKITIFLGSPRKNGNTAKLLKKIEEYFKNLKYEIIFLPEYNIKPCKECFVCQKNENSPACAIKDDMQIMYNKMSEADMIILACPIFCWSFPAQIKAFLDRTFCLDKFYEDGTYKSLMKNKKAALALTALGDEFEGADLVVQAYERMLKLHRMKDIAKIAICNFTSPAILEESLILSKVKKFSHIIINELKR